MNIADRCTFRKDMYLAMTPNNNSPKRFKAPTSKTSDAVTPIEKFEFRATQREPEVIANLRKGAAIKGMDMSDFAREAVTAAYERVTAGQPIRGEINRALIGTNQKRAPFLSSVPCGPWKEALEAASSFAISEDTADELEFHNDDVWVRANGQSMEGAGIGDGVLVAIRPYGAKAPRRGESVLIQVICEDEKCLGTLKTFDGFDSVTGLPKLKDGDGQPYSYPEKVLRFEVIGRAVAQMGRL